VSDHIQVHSVAVDLVEDLLHWKWTLIPRGFQKSPVEEGGVATVEEALQAKGSGAKAQLSLQLPTVCLSLGEISLLLEGQLLVVLVK